MIDDCTDRNNLIEIQRLESKKVKGHNIYWQHGLHGTLFVMLRIAFMRCLNMRKCVCVSPPLRLLGLVITAKPKPPNKSLTQPA